MKTSINNEIGLFGYGTVGQGFYHYVSRSKQEERIPNIVIKGKNRDKSKSFLQNGESLITEEKVGTIVELINNEKDAFDIVSNALKKGKTVVSANKKLIAEHLEELIGLEKEYGGKFLYEGAVCGSIPIIRILNDFYNEEPIIEIRGIFNGSSNYILTKLFNTDISYESALAQAQEKGFAEADPTSDVGGFDALYKLIILTAHAFGKILKPEQVLNLGIDRISSDDIEFAKRFGLKIKQVAKVVKHRGKLSLSVVPTLIDNSSELYTTDEEYNGVLVNSENVGKQFYKGKGAGSLPTGSVVFSDLKAIDNGYQYSYSKLRNSEGEPAQNTQIEVLVRLQGIINFPIGFSNVTPIERGLFLAKTTLEDLKLNKDNLAENGLSVIFIDNENIKQKIKDYANTISTSRRALSL